MTVQLNQTVPKVFDALAAGIALRAHRIVPNDEGRLRNSPLTLFRGKLPKISRLTQLANFQDGTRLGTSYPTPFVAGKLLRQRVRRLKCSDGVAKFKVGIRYVENLGLNVYANVPVIGGIPQGFEYIGDFEVPYPGSIGINAASTSFGDPLNIGSSGRGSATITFTTTDPRPNDPYAPQGIETTLSLGSLGRGYDFLYPGIVETVEESSGCPVVFRSRLWLAAYHIGVLRYNLSILLVIEDV